MPVFTTANQLEYFSFLCVIFCFLDVHCYRLNTIAFLNDQRIIYILLIELWSWESLTFYVNVIVHKIRLRFYRYLILSSSSSIN